MLLPKKFEAYLKTEHNVSGKTLRNYRADLVHFISWAKGQLVNSGAVITQTEDLLPYFDSNLVQGYKDHHTNTSTPKSTTNRRLSTLRNFAKFLVQTGALQQNPTLTLQNVKPNLTTEEQVSVIIAGFQKHLESEGVSRVTLKNYMSDVKQFLAWVPGQVTQA